MPINTISTMGKLSAYFKKMTLPGFMGFSVYEIGREIIKSENHIRLAERAAAISFNLLMAIPPTLIFLASLLPFFPLQGVEDTILTAIKIITPDNEMYDSIAEVVSDFLNTRQRELLSIGILFTIFYSSNGVMGLMRAFDRVDNTAIKFRTGWNRRWKAIRLTILLMLLMFVLIAAFILQSKIAQYVFESFPYQATWIKLLATLTMILILFIMICIIYRNGPSLYKKFPFFSAGAGVAAVSSIIVSVVFFYIASNFIQYNKIYGSIGTLLMFMVWLFITSNILIIGFEINLTLQKKKLTRNS